MNYTKKLSRERKSRPMDLCTKIEQERVRAISPARPTTSQQPQPQAKSIVNQRIINHQSIILLTIISSFPGFCFQQWTYISYQNPCHTILSAIKKSKENSRILCALDKMNTNENRSTRRRGLVTLLTSALLSLIPPTITAHDKTMIAYYASWQVGDPCTYFHFHSNEIKYSVQI